MHLTTSKAYWAMSLLLLSQCTADVEKKPWKCNNANLCYMDPNDEPSTPSFESQKDCRLSCGKYGSVWPMPTQECNIAHERVYFDPLKVRFNVVAPNSHTSQFIREANRIFVSNALKECNRNCTLSQSKEILVKATVNSTSLNLDWETDESYSLSLRTTEMATFVDIRAITVFGARHGLETLSNLITGGIGNGLIMVAGARIRDRPMFPHRGLLLDCSRNFIPMRSIKTTLDAMAASKLNVFHWHVADSQSFPLEITRIPELQRFGAYTPEHVYSRTDTQNLIKYAKIRGIRVLVELDGPSHAGMGWQWGPMAGLGNLTVCMNKQPWRSFCYQPPCGQLNPVNDNIYGLLKEVFEDIAEFSAPEETIHMGGDEVFIPCWNETEEIVDKMLKTGYDRSTLSFLKLWADFHSKNLESWDDVNQRLHPNLQVPKSVVIWSSHLTDPSLIAGFLPKERYVIQTWVDSSTTLNRDLLSMGYRIIVSTKDAWYLDHGFWGKTNYYNWQKVYGNHLVREENMLGGEVCMWSEYVDENSLDGRVWPRAGAAAERLWANPKISAMLVEPRFYRYRDRLIARGVRPDAVTPKWCVLREGNCY